MNIFLLHENPVLCAEQHCDKHVVKMVIEYAQLMSTAHRYLDGELYGEKTEELSNDGDILILTWKLLYTRLVMSITQMVYGLEAVMPIIITYIIYGVGYVRNILTGMVGNT